MNDDQFSCPHCHRPVSARATVCEICSCEIPDGHFRLANALFKSNRIEEAAAAYQRTIDLVPDHYKAIHNLALCRHNTGAPPQSASPSVPLFLQIVLGMVAAGIILWLIYQSAVVEPAAKKAHKEEFEADMKSSERRGELLDRWIHGGPGAAEARREYNQELERDKARKNARK